MKKSKKYYATFDRNGTEDEIIIHTPQGRPMLSVAFWDEQFLEPDDPEWVAIDQKKADAMLIVNALNAYPRSSPKKTTNDDKAFIVEAITYTIKEIDYWHRDVFIEGEEKHPLHSNWAHAYSKLRTARDILSARSRGRKPV
jgi:hypothetical protein